MVIVKTARSSDVNMDILYEYFIGTIGINKLRSLTPNFAYTLALFQCNPLIIKNSQVDLKKFCTDDINNIDSRNYVIYEKIIGESMGGSTEDEDNANYNKIIKTLAKEITIEKENE